MKITTRNYFDVIEKIGLENLPIPLKQSHSVIDTKTDNGSNWKSITSDTELKSVMDLSFQKLGEFQNSNKSLSGIENSNQLVVKFIKEYLELEDKTTFKEDIDNFILRIKSAIENGKISNIESKEKEIQNIFNSLISIRNRMGREINISFKPQTKEKLKTILKVSTFAVKKKVRKKTNDDNELSGVEELEAIPKSDLHILSSTDFINQHFDKIDFKGKWQDFIGNPSPGFTAMVFGKPKMGKSYLCVDFAGYLARNHGKVLYVAKEEKLDATLQLKLKDKNVAHENLYVADNLPKDLSEYQFVVLDSVNKLGLSTVDLENLKKSNPKISFIYIFQTTKDGNFRGTNQFQHDVDVVIEIPEKGKAVQYGRFNQGGEMDIFKKEESFASEDLQGLNNNAMLAGTKEKNMKADKKATTWVIDKSLNKRDKADLKRIKELYEEGKLKEAMKQASELDTFVREFIPLAIWKRLGGELTPSGEERLKKATTKKGRDFDENVPDDLNPRFIFSITHSQLLSNILKNKIDLEYLLRRELSNRGLNEDGKWVGFDAAKKMHKIE